MGAPDIDSTERPSKLRKTVHAGHSPTAEVVYVQQAAEPAKQGESGTDSCLLESKHDAITVAAGANEENIPSDPNPARSGDHGGSMSKNQQKKLRRQQEWEAKKPLRKALKKEQRKAKKERDRARRATEDEATKQARASLRKEGQLLPVTVIFDCGYDDLMYDKEIVSLGSQLTRCYSENRNARFKAHLSVSSFTGRLRERFDTVLKGAYKSWNGFTFTDAGFDDAANQAKDIMESQRSQSFGGAFAAEQCDERAGDEGSGPTSGVVENTAGEIIYLSSDSDYTLTELKPFSTYIIGGLVDRNRYKGRCHKAAEGKGVKTARLPIGEYLEMSTRHILTTNQVLEIMLKWLELRDWGAAFTAVIPKRKGGMLKSENNPKSSGVDAECIIEESGGDSEEVDEAHESSDDVTGTTAANGSGATNSAPTQEVGQN